MSDPALASVSSIESSAMEPGYDPAIEANSRDNGIARKETVYVNRMRALVGIVLVASTVGVATSVYYHTKNTETTQFETQFKDDAFKVLEETGAVFDRTLSLLDTFATNVVSYARASNQTWPFVTIPDFAMKAAKFRTVMLGIGVWLLPVVSPSQRIEWEEYAWTHNEWANETLIRQARDKTYFGPTASEPQPIREVFGGASEIIPYNITRRLMPDWQQYPLVDIRPNYNYDWLSPYSEVGDISGFLDNRKAGMTVTYLLPDPNDPKEVEENAEWALWLQDYLRPEDSSNEPVFDLHYPALDKLDSIQATDESFNISQYSAVATITTVVYWRDIIRNILPPGRRGIVIVFDSPCNPSFTYQLDGPTTTFLGRGDNHDTKYDYLVIESNFFDLDSFSQTYSEYSELNFEEKECPVSLRVYPSDTMKQQFTTSNPAIFATTAVAIFAFASFVFLLYDFKVERRQKLVMSSAVKTNAIVSSLFPTKVRDKMMNEQDPELSSKGKRKAIMPHSMFRTKQTDREMVQIQDSTRPLADNYPETTVIFADISGFTAWSSVRDPHHVFTLLEALFGAFDKRAASRKVFKVETIGDCYVAVTGLPEPNRNHAVAMCRFAMDCVEETVKVTGELETTLGPGTTNLKIRVGLNSGQTIAGVLRGEKSRFQLFGDTINTAARMESTGEPGRIQASAMTADLLVAAGKESWITERSNLVEAKGKGMMKTYWVWAKARGSSSQSPSDPGQPNYDMGNIVEVTKEVVIGRLVEWNVNIFIGLLSQVVSKNSSTTVAAKHTNHSNMTSYESRKPIDEVVEIIDMPKYQNNEGTDVQISKLSPNVKDQVRNFVSTIAFMHKGNAFHNFEHASNVVMSAFKMMNADAIKAPTAGCEESEKKKLDPLTQLAIVFAAMIHDVDHPGISNDQLVQQKNPIAVLYSGRSVAEQNAFEMSWSLFMNPNFDKLRLAMFANDSDLNHFRQVVVNAVMATDIFDKDEENWQSRWDICFGTELQHEVSDECMNRQATIVIEDLIVASDVIHTMQHWNVYQQWNKQLFQEMYIAYRLGHSSQDPSEGWYEGELMFFDKYIIPLAQRFKSYGAFGLQRDDFLVCAMSNRHEWDIRGREISFKLLQEANATWEDE